MVRISANDELLYSARNAVKPWLSVDAAYDRPLYHPDPQDVIDICLKCSCKDCTYPDCGCENTPKTARNERSEHFTRLFRSGRNKREIMSEMGINERMYFRLKKAANI